MEFYQDLILTAVISLIFIFLLGKLAVAPADVTVAVTPAAAADAGGSSRGSRTPRIGGKRVSFRDPIESGGVESVPAKESAEIGVDRVDEKSVTELQWVKGLESEIIESWKSLADPVVDEGVVEGELVIESPELLNELINEDRLEELLIESGEMGEVKEIGAESGVDVVDEDEVNEAGLEGELVVGSLELPGILTSPSERNAEVDGFEGNEARSEGELVIGLPEMTEVEKLPDSSLGTELEISPESRDADASQAKVEGEIAAESASVMAEGEIVVSPGPELEIVRSLEEVKKDEFGDQTVGEGSGEDEALQENEARVGLEEVEKNELEDQIVGEGSREDEALHVNEARAGGSVIQSLETEKPAESSRQLVEEEFVESGDEVKIVRSMDESVTGEEGGGDEAVGSLLLGEDEWEGIERSEPEKLFAVATSFTSSATGSEELSRLSSDVQMQLYGLHKVATEGPCYEAQPMALMVSSRAKWHAWQRLGNMNPEVAMEHYISLLTRSIPGWIVTKIGGTTTQGSNDPPVDQVVESGTPDSGTPLCSEPSSVFVRESKEQIIADKSFDGSTPSWQGSK